tara:strand:+ start:72182 stop:72883 length:702 start_codon:yes stop_codon:yes gene_type:complete
MDNLTKVFNDSDNKVEKKALVVMSGGQDSVTCLYWALRKYSEVNVISFAYGQKHETEINLAKSICDREDVNFTSLDISSVMINKDSGLLDDTGDVNSLNSKGLPNSFVPNRNQLFLTLAHSYAQLIGAEYIVTGVCQTDYSGYPDCREEFIKWLQHTTNLGSQENIKIVTPLMHLTKAETFGLAALMDVLPVIINDTLTCYNGDLTQNEWGKGCGDCPACELRKKGFYEYIGE